METRKIIDMHSHYFSKEYLALLKEYHIDHPDNVFVPTWDMDEHLQKMDALGICYSLLSITSPFFSFVEPEKLSSKVRMINETGADLLSAHPDRLGLLAALPLPDPAASVQEIHYAYETLHVKGIALPTNANGVYLGDPSLDPVMEALNEHHALVTLHPTSPAMVIPNVNETLPIPLFEFYVDTARTMLNMVYRNVFRRYPNIRFIMPHAGGCFSTMTGRLSSGAGAQLDIIENMKLMYFDLCGMPFPTQFNALLPIIGTDRMVYGLDFPYGNVPGAKEHEQRLLNTGLSEEDLQKIFYKNAENLLQ